MRSHGLKSETRTLLTSGKKAAVACFSHCSLSFSPSACRCVLVAFDVRGCSAVVITSQPLHLKVCRFDKRQAPAAGHFPPLSLSSANTLCRITFLPACQREGKVIIEFNFAPKCREFALQSQQCKFPTRN